MKIAIYHNLSSGGAKRTLLELVRRLTETNELHVYTLSCANHDFFDIRPYVKQHKIYSFTPGKLLKPPFGRLNQLIRLSDISRLKRLTKHISTTIDNQGYELVFVNPCQFENSPSILTYLNKTPSVFFLQEPLRKIYETPPVRPYDNHETAIRKFINYFDPLPGIYQAAIRKNDRQNVLSAKTVLVNSQFIQESAERIYGIDATVNYLGVDTHFFQPNVKSKKDFVFSVGSMTPLKGFDFIVRSIGLIPVEERPRLVIASNFSNPPEQAYIQNLAKESGVSLELQAGITDQKLVELYNQAALTVYAPVREPFGLVAIESMACATPLVAVREGGIRETVVHGETGLLTARDEGEFARAVQELMADPQRAAQMGHNGRKAVLEKWTWEAAVDRLEKNFFAAVNS